MSRSIKKASLGLRSSQKLGTAKVMISPRPKEGIGGAVLQEAGKDWSMEEGYVARDVVAEESSHHQNLDPVGMK